MKKYFDNYTFLKILLLILFTFPISYFGIKDIEIYQHGYFTASTYINDIKTFIDGYIDFYGPGISLPIGAFPIFNPLSLLINKPQLFYFFYLIINLIIQLHFAKIICKRLSLKYNSLTILTLIFSISNFNYVYSDDWPMTFWTYTSIFPLIYYSIKFFDKKDDKSFIKLLLFLQLSLAFGSFGSSLKNIIFLTLFFLLNFNFSFFNIRRVLYFFLFCLSLIATIDHLYFEYLNFENTTETPSLIDSDYSLKEYFYSLFNPIYFFLDISNWSINRMPGYGIMLFLIAYSLLQNIFKKKNFYKLSIIFFLFLFLSLSQILIDLKFPISGVWGFRDYLNIISVLLVAEFILRIKKIKIKKIIKILIISYSIFFYIFNFQNFIDFSKNNFIAKKIENYDLIESFEKFKNTNNNYGKFFLSYKVYNNIRNGYRNYGIYAITDLIKYNIYPFNGWFKYLSMKEFFQDEVKMHGKIESDYKIINNEVFLKSFLIKYLLVYKSEIEKIKIDFDIIEKIKLDEDEILILKISNDNFPIIKKNIQIINSCEKLNNIFCVLNLDNFVFNQKLKIEKIDINHFVFINDNSYDVFALFPFSKINNWKQSTTVEIFDFYENYKIIKLKANEKVFFKYKNTKRIYLKILSLISFLILLIICLIQKKSFLYKKN